MMTIISLLVLNKKMTNANVEKKGKEYQKMNHKLKLTITKK